MPKEIIQKQVKRKYSVLADKNKEIIEDYYSGQSSWVLSKKYNCSKAGILRLLKMNNVTRRIHKRIFPSGELIDLYLNQKKSITEIVKLTHSHEATIRKNLKQLGIVPRSFNEQQALDIERGLKSNLNKIRDDVEKDPRFFYTLGAFKGDGHYNIKQNKVQISVTDLDFLEEIKRVFNMLSPETRMNIIEHKEATERTKKQWRMNICSRDFFKKELHKIIPQTLQEKRFYLMGLFDAEGSASRNGLAITICQKNIDDLRMWKDWLNELGINTSMNIRKGIPVSYLHSNGKMYLSPRDGGSLRVIGNDSKINFNDVIGFRIKRKQQRLENGIKKIHPLAEYLISEELALQDLNKLAICKVKSIKISHREQGVDLSILDSEYHNFVLDNGIVSMNSTLAQQIGYFAAWMQAGGVMEPDPIRPNQLVMKKAPTKPIHFSLDNLVFTPEDLIKKAEDLYRKFGKGQVIIYDEGRAGLDSARAMEAVNKIMQDFFQECGQYGHIILIVLPNFFRLHEDYATSRSLFLVDVYADARLKRGYFNFYNDITKEYLYYSGKKKIGNALKYNGARVSFSGRFTPFSPLNKEEYDKAKRAGLKKKQMKTKEVIWKRQRDAAIHLLRKASGWTFDMIAKELTVSSGLFLSELSVRHAIENITHEKTENQV